jgi:RHS repeat-associated protein
MSAAGVVSDTRVYDPFGDVAGTSGVTDPSVGFQGDYTDPVSGEVWMGARWYSGADAVFRSRDSVLGELVSPVSLNRYTYGWANPLRHWDPDGRYVLEGDGGPGVTEHYGVTNSRSSHRNRMIHRAENVAKDVRDRANGTPFESAAAQITTASVFEWMTLAEQEARARPTGMYINGGAWVEFPPGYQDFSPHEKVEWITQADPELAAPQHNLAWDVVSAVGVHGSRGLVNFGSGAVDGLTNTVTFGHGTSVGPVFDDPIYSYSYVTGQITANVELGLAVSAVRPADVGLDAVSCIQSVFGGASWGLR